MNSARLVPVAFLALAASAHVTGAQEVPRGTAPLARLEQALDRETYRAVVQVIEEARARALPADPLVAGALAVGVPRETLRMIRSIQPGRSVAVPLGVLTELVARRVPVDRAATLVVDLLRRGAT